MFGQHPFGNISNQLRSPSRGNQSNQMCLGMMSPKPNRVMSQRGFKNPSPFTSNNEGGQWANQMKQISKENSFYGAKSGVNNPILSGYQGMNQQRQFDIVKSPVRNNQQGKTVRGAFDRGLVASINGEVSNYMRTEADSKCNDYQNAVMYSPRVMRSPTQPQESMQFKSPMKSNQSTGIANQNQKGVQGNYTRAQANGHSHVKSVQNFQSPQRGNQGNQYQPNQQQYNQYNQYNGGWNCYNQNQYHYNQYQYPTQNGNGNQYFQNQQQAYLYQQQMLWAQQQYLQQQCVDTSANHNMRSPQRPKKSENDPKFIPQELENQPKDESILLSPARGQETASRVKIHAHGKRVYSNEKPKETPKSNFNTTALVESKDKIEDMFQKAVQRSLELSQRIKDKEARLKPKELPTVEKVVETKIIEGKYEGDLSDNGLPHGKGRVIYSSNESYEGEWKEGNRHGFGILYNKKGEQVYCGDWENDFFHGQGVLCNLDARKIENDSFDYTNFSNVDFVWTNYEGEFKEGLMDGLGIIYLSNGERYNGSFRGGKISGEGSFQKKSGELVMGQWNNDKLVKIL